MICCPNARGLKADDLGHEPVHVARQAHELSLNPVKLSGPGVKFGDTRNQGIP